MPRLPNRGNTQLAPGTAREFPAFPNFDPQLAEIDGGATNAAIQRWNTLMRARLEGNAQQDNGRFRDIQTTVDRADGYLESVWTMQAIAGPVVTGMTLFSSAGPDNQTVSRITFQADVFQIQTATGNHKTVFTTSADAIKLGDVLTIDLANSRVYIGTGTYANSNTAFYVDDDGFFSLKNKLAFDPTGTGTLTITGTIIATAGSIGGWDINATTISKNNAVLDSAGQLILGTLNDVIYISATDTVYRMWAGSVTAGMATFSVTKAGALFSTAGLIAGFSIAPNALTAGTGANYIQMSNGVGTTRFQLGDTAATNLFLQRGSGGSGGLYIFLSGQVASHASIQMDSSGYGVVSLTDASANETARLDTGVSSSATLSLGVSGAARALLRRSISGTPALFLFNAANAQVVDLEADVTSSCGYLRISNAAGSSYIEVDGGKISAAPTINASGNLTFSTAGTLRGYFDTAFNLVVTNGTVNALMAVDTGASRMTVGTSTNHSLQFLTNSVLTWLIGTDSHLKSNGGDIRKLSSDGWSPKLFDGTNEIEFQGAGGQIFGRLNGGAAILLG